MSNILACSTGPQLCYRSRGDTVAKHKSAESCDRRYGGLSYPSLGNWGERRWLARVISSTRTRQLTSEAQGRNHPMTRNHRFARWLIAGLSITAFVGLQGATLTAQAATYSTHSISKSTTSYSTSAKVPPGVHFDASVRPRAALSANWQQKFNSVMAVAQSKLGTPYIWGHNEDRGQYGFDCSNFTAYVYHHALGYRMSGSSQTQASSVGWRVPIHSMRPGDLIIEDGGHHVGIYAGNGQMIQEGGGLGKVGYLRLTPGSYWYNHITAVKRMF